MHVGKETMNKLYGGRRPSTTRGAFQSSGLLWTLGVALMFAIFAVSGLRFAAPSSYYSKLALFGAIALLALRQINRRLGRKRSRAAEPDPQSRLNLQ